MTKRINLDDYVDVVGGRLSNLDLAPDIMFQFEQRKSSEVILRITHTRNHYYGKIYIPKRYFVESKK